MFNKIRERKLVSELKKILKEKDTMFRSIALNTLKAKAGRLVFENKISFDFYSQIFGGEDNYNKHYWIINKKNIEKFF